MKNEKIFRDRMFLYPTQITRLRREYETVKFFNCKFMFSELRLTEFKNVEFIDCNFNSSFKLEARCEKLTFSHCNLDRNFSLSGSINTLKFDSYSSGTLLNSEFNCIYLDLKNAQIRFDHTHLYLLRMCRLEEANLVVFGDDSIFEVNELFIDSLGELTIKSAKAIIDHLYLNNAGLISLDDTEDHRFSRDRITAIEVFEAGSPKGFLRSKGSKTILFNGHLIDGFTEAVNGICMTRYMSIPYNVNM